MSLVAVEERLAADNRDQAYEITRYVAQLCYPTPVPGGLIKDADNVHTILQVLVNQGSCSGEVYMTLINRFPTLSRLIDMLHLVGQPLPVWLRLSFQVLTRQIVNLREVANRPNAVPLNDEFVPVDPNGNHRLRRAQAMLVD